MFRSSNVIKIDVTNSFQPAYMCFRKTWPSLLYSWNFAILVQSGYSFTWNMCMHSSRGATRWCKVWPKQTSCTNWSPWSYYSYMHLEISQLNLYAIQLHSKALIHEWKQVMHLSKVITVDCNIAVGGRICSCNRIHGRCWMLDFMHAVNIHTTLWEAALSFIRSMHGILMIAIDVLRIANLPVAPHIGLICRLDWANPCFAQWEFPHHATLFVA